MLRTDRNISSISVVAFVDRQHQQIQMEYPANKTKQTIEKSNSSKILENNAPEMANLAIVGLTLIFIVNS